MSMRNAFRKNQNLTPEEAEERRQKRSRRAVSRMWRATAQVLTVVMCTEALLGSGVASAMAETYDDAQEWNSVAAQVADANTGADSSATDDSASTDANAVSDSTQAASTVDTSGSQGDDTSAQQDAFVSADSSSTTNSSAEAAQPAATSSSSSEQATAESQSDEETQPSDEAEEDTEVEEQLDTRDWTSATDNLVLSSDGILFDEKLAELAAERADAEDQAESEDDVDVAKYGKAAEKLSGVTLPDELPASLNVRGALDATAADGRDGNADHNKLVAGDTFTVALPENISFISDDGSEFDLYEPNAAGEPGTVKVAHATVKGSKLKVKVIDPVDTATGAATELGASLSFVANLDVKMASSVVKKSESTLVWDIQSGKSIELSVPSKKSISQMLGLLVEAQASEPAIVDETVADDASDDEFELEIHGGDTVEMTKTLELTTNGKGVQWESSDETVATVDADGTVSGIKPGKVTITAACSIDNVTYTASKELTVTETPGNTATKFAGTASYTTVWADGGDASRRPASIDGLYTLQFTTDGGKTWSDYDKTSEIIYTGLGISADEAAEIGISVVDKGQSYIASATGKLPSNVHVVHDDLSTEEVAVSWRIVSSVADFISDNYVKLQKGDYDGAFDDEYFGDDANKECFQLLQDVSFNINLRDAAVRMGTVSTLEGWYEKLGYKETVQVLNGSTEVASYSKENLKSYLEDSSASFTPDDNKLTLSFMAPAYYPDNNSLDYNLTHNTGTIDKKDDGTCDYYQVSYSNTGVANHGSNIVAAYNGGNVYLTHAGTTTFAATKQWFDEDSSTRPATTYSLWRYSTNGGSAATAAQVADSAGKYIEFKVSAATNKASDQIDLAAQMKSAGFDVQGQLNKYDPDGYPYIYFLREDEVDGYKRVAGTVANDGSITYDHAVYYGSDYEDGSWNTVDLTSATASDGNVIIYNTGTISNVRTDTTKALTSKTWEAGAFQDQLKDIAVTMTLKRRLKNVDGSEWETVKNGSGDYTKELSGWTAGAFTMDAEANVAKYDALGREYEYIWCETNITSTTSGKVVGCKQNDDGVTLTSVLKLKDENGKDQKITFIGSYDESKGLITNTYSGETVARVVKKWNVKGSPEGATAANPYGATRGEDGKLYFTYTYTDDDGKEQTTTKEFPESVSFSLYQNDTVFAEGLKMDGTVDTEWKTATCKDGKTTIRYRESAAWQLDFDDLPQYDASGSKYTYQSFEDTPSGFSSSSSFLPGGDANTLVDADGNTVDEVNLTNCSNSPYPGEGTTIRLTKNWVDDGNTTGRNDITMRITFLNDVVKKDGTVLYSAGDYREISLNDHNGWYLELGIGASGGRYLAPGEEQKKLSSGFYYTVEEVSNTYYDVVTMDTAPDSVKLSPWAGEKRLVSKSATHGSTYAYDISYTTSTRTVGNRTVSVIETTNRRVGLVNVELSKTWTDRGADISQRPNAKYKVASTSGDKIFFADDDGKIYVTLPSFKNDTKYYLYKDASHTEALTTSDASIVSDGAAITIAVDKTVASGASTSFNFYGLPKYNWNGSTFDYTVSEVLPDNDKGYASSEVYNTESLNSDYQHAETKQASFSNYRSGTKDITFHTRWYDQYVKEDLSQRPDVYITLYRGVVNDDGSTTIETTPVTGYESYKWQGTGETGLDAKYAQYATIKNLPKYDANGAEYVYYAKMTTSVNQGTYKALDYTDPAYATNPDKTDDDQYSGDTKNASSLWNSVDEEVEDADASQVLNGSTVLREQGTFVYSLANTITVSGTKVWSNVPEDYKDNLPAISMFLQRAYIDDGHKGFSGLAMSESDPGITGKGYTVTTDFESEQADGQTVVAYVTFANMPASQKTYTFTFNYYGKNNADGTYAGDGTATQLPLYDSAGMRYAYNTREVIDGIIQDAEGEPAGGISLSDLIGQHSEAQSDYTIYSPTITSSGNGRTFRIDNAFVDQDQEGQIIVTKHFAGRADGDHFPTTTFTLFRKGTDGEWYEVESKDLDTSKIDDENGTATVTFTDLAIYNPAGDKYEYKVEETAIDGYKTYAATGEKKSNEIATDSESSAVEGLTAQADGKQDDSSNATFKNVYESGSVSINGTKKWGDSNNQFDTREDIFSTLVLTRRCHAGDHTETVKLQNTDASADNYFAWTSDTTGSSAYTSFNISNLEKWAPDGKAWVYELNEDSSKVDSDSKLNQYTLNSKAVSAQTDAASPTFGALANNLKTSVKATKRFAESSDAYAQRPRVYVTLQVSDDNGSSWTDASTFFSADTYSVNGKSVNFTQSLDGFSGSDSKSYTWSQLPVSYNGKTLVYRAVESKLAYDSANAAGSEAMVDTPSIDADGNYSNVSGSYKPSQTTSTSGDVTTIDITNTFDKITTLTITKTWDDQDDKWGERPDSVTYLLQRTVDGGTTWEWVAKNNAAIKSPFVNGRVNSRLVQLSLSKGTGNTWSFTTENLPAQDASGNTYTYRAAEVVPTGYTVENGKQIAASSSTVISVLNDDETEFDNSHDIVSVSGTKSWITYGADLPASVKLKVYQIKGSKKTDITDSVVFDWKGTDTNIWTYTISGLPKTAKDGTTYQYLVTEEAGAVDGFYPSVNATASASAQDAFAPDKLTNSEIENTATKFTFNKIDEATGTGASGANLNGVEFTVKDDSGNAVAVWKRDADGTESVTGSGCKGVVDNDNKAYVVGLKAGTYTVSETVVPENHLKIADFTLTIANDGSVSENSASATVANAEGTKVATVTVADTVVRGGVSLYKYYKHGSDKVGLAMTFDLYKKGDTDGDDTLIAKKITTDSKGNWSNEKSDIAVTGLGDYYKTLADGLPLGSYYFKETGESDYTVKASTKYEFEIADNGASQPKTATVDAENEEFNATATLDKLDAEDGSGVNEAVFKLEYGSDENPVTVATFNNYGFRSGRAYTLDASGTAMEYYGSDNPVTGRLTISGLKKGRYKLTEISNRGYEVNTKVMVLIVREENQGKTLAFTVDGTLTNTRKKGTLTLNKTDGNKKALDDCVFKLQRKNGLLWEDVEGQTGLTTDEKGKISVSDLEWGTYRFVEVSPKAGYYGTATTEEITINRWNVDAEYADQLTFKTVSNTATSLTLAKQSGGKTVSAGSATFSVTGTFAGGTAEETRTYSTTKGSVAITGELVVGNTYTIKETEAPAGYEVEKSSAKVTVNDDGTFAIADNNSTFTLSDDKKTVTKSDEPITLDLYKHDADNKSTAIVATYKVTPADGSTFADGSAEAKSCTTGKDGKKQIKAELKQGCTYVLSEVKADGYKISANELTFTVAEDGTISGADTSDMKIGDDKVSIDLSDDAIVMTVGKSATGYDAERMSGAEFTITGTFADGSTSQKLTVGDNGASDKLSALLVAGNTYKIEESKAPAGFKVISGSMSFTVSNEGKLSRVASEQGVADAWSIAENGIRVNAVDEPVSLSVLKESADANEDGTHTVLDGAKFTVSGTFADGTTEKTLETEDGQAATLDGQLVVGNEYTLAETKAPKGYRRVKDTLTFTVQDDGAFKVKGESSDYFGVSSGEIVCFTGKVFNDPTTLTIKKVDATYTDKVLGGATFVLSGIFTDGTTAAKTYTTDATTGSVTIDKSILNADGTTKYTLQEIVAPDGYEVNTAAYSFTVDEYGAIKPVETVSGYSVDANNEILVTAADNPLYVQIEKKGSDGAESLSDARYTIEALDEDGAIYGKNGKATTKLTDQIAAEIAETRIRQGGTYSITETAAPAGYELLGKTFKFKVDTSGNIVDLSVPEGINGSVVASGSQLTITDIQTSITLAKKGSETGDALLANATFDIINTETSKTVKTVTTADDRSVSIDGLVAGTEYELKETTAPDGYECTVDFVFTMNADGTISWKGDLPKGIAVADGNIAITATDDPIHVQVVKVDADDNSKTLDGALYTIEAADKYAAFIGKAEDKLTNQTAAQIAELQLKQGGTYRLTETTAPAGYELLGKDIDFKVGDTGTVTLVSKKDGLNGTVDIAGSTLTLGDTASGVTFYKAATDDGAMDGTVLTVTPAEGSRFVDGSASKELTMVDKGGSYSAAIGGQLIAGNTYMLTEKTAHDGYSMFTGSFIFKAKADGTVEQVSSTIANGSVSIGEDGVSITATDEPIELTIEKTNATGSKKLVGAVFAIADSDGNVVDTVTTGDDGTVVSSKKLSVGKTYTLSETKAPKGYKQLTATFTFTVNADGTIAAADSAKVDPAYSIASDGSIAARGVSAKNQSTGLTLYKRSADGTTVLTSEAIFELTGEFASGSKTVTLKTSGDNGSAVLDEAELIADGQTVYTLKETEAPKGYELNTREFKFTVATDGTITAQEGMTDSGYSVNADGVSIVARDSASDVTVSKVSSVDGAALDGAEFSLAPTEGSAFADGSVEAIVLDSKSGYSVNSKLVSGNSYKLSEVKAPEGYKLMTEALTFTVNADGTLAVDDADATKAAGWTVDNSADSVIVTAADDPITFSVVKTADGADAAAMANAEFEVTGVFAGKSKESTETITTDASGVAKLADAKIVAGGSYTVKETKAPSGYELSDKEVTVAVAKDGTVSAKLDGGSPWTVSDSAVSITLEDSQTGVSLVKTDADDSDAVLAGASFTLSGNFPDGKGGVVAGTKTVVTKADGKLTVDGADAAVVNGLVAGETYRLVETAAPEGYELDATPVTFTVKADGAVEVSEGNNGVLTLAKGGKGLVVSDKSIHISVVKYGNDDSTTVLNGARYTIEAADENAAFVGSEKTKFEDQGASDLAALQLKQGGTYRLTETKAPEGYELLGKSVEFKVDESGNVTDLNVPTDIDGSVVTNSSKLTITDVKTSLSLAKKGSGNDGALLAGAEFSLKGDGVDKVVTTSAEEMTSIDGLVAGKTYTLSETKAPAGYEKTVGDFTFTMNADGTISWKGELPKGINVADGNVAITAVDDPIHVTVDKIGIDGEPLFGALYTIEAVKDAAFVGESNTKLENMSGSDIEKLLFKQGGTYRLTETTAPAGYELLGKSIEFTVNEKGEVADLTVPEGTNGSAKAEGSIIDVTDNAVALTLKKQGADEKKLSGAEFSVRGRFANSDGTLGDEIVETAVTVDSFASLRFAAGQSYELTETKAPAGYELVAQPMTFTVKADGTLEGDAVDDNGTITVTGDTVVATDLPVEIVLAKVDSDGSGLADAVFSVEGLFANSEEVDAKELITDEDGTATVTGLVAGQTYSITEVTAPQGYTKSAVALTVTVKADGTLESAGADGWSVDGDAAKVTLADVKTSFQIQKTASDGKTSGLDGAEFQVEGTFANASKSEKKTLATADNGMTEALEGQLVVGNEYTVTETKAPAGYKLAAGSLTFKVADDGTLQKVSSEGAFSLMGGAAGISVADDPVSITFKKVASDNGDMDGAVLTLVPADGSAFVDGAASKDLNMAKSDDSSFSATLSGQLVAGNTYALTEKKAHDGYSMFTGSFSFTVNADGTVEKVSDDVSNGYVSIDNGRVSITATDEPVELAVEKTSADGSKKLGGAEFVIKDSAGSVVDSLVTDADGAAASAKKLSVGQTYTIVETKAPEGYELDATPMTFKVAADGTVEVVDDNDGMLTVVKNGRGLSISDQATELKIQKTGADGADGGAMAGATFKIAGVFAGSDDATTETLSVNGDGASDVLAAKLVVGNVYTVKETKAPKGYMVLDGTLSFKVNDNGTLQIITAVDGYAIDSDGSVAVIKANDPVTSLKLTKQASDGASASAMAGAKFKVTGDAFAGSAQGEDAIELTVAEDGTAVVAGQLVAGATYTVEETKAPTGYALIDGKLTFTVSADGRSIDTASVAYEGNDEGKLSIAMGTDQNGAPQMQVTAIDDPVTAVFKKVDGNGSGLAGASFRVVSVGDSSLDTILTVDETGIATLSAQLVVGKTYTVTETVSPAGYTLPAGGYTFRVLSDGSIEDASIADASVVNDACYRVMDDGIVGIEAVDQPTRVSFTKKALDGADSTAIKGCELTIVPEDGSSFADGASSHTVVIGEDGTSEELVGVFIVHNSYKIYESKAPDGYSKYTGSLVFTVNADGTLQKVSSSVDNGTADIFDDGSGVATADEAIMITVAKTDESGEKKLAGAEFSIADASGAVVDTLVTDANGLASSSRKLCVGGSYTLMETKAPNGYLAVDGKFVFTIGDDGSIVSSSADGISNGSVKLSEDARTLTVSDVAIPAEVAEATSTPQSKATKGAMPATGDEQLWSVTTMALLGAAFILIGSRKRREH